MYLFKAKFVGRKLGAIGIFYYIIDYCVGENTIEALADLGNTYEHIHKPTFILVEQLQAQ
jgi:hypothetical protein